MWRLQEQSTASGADIDPEAQESQWMVRTKHIKEWRFDCTREFSSFCVRPILQMGVNRELLHVAPGSFSYQSRFSFIESKAVSLSILKC